MKGDEVVTIAKILAKLQAEEKLTAIEILTLLPYYYTGQVNKRLGRYRNR